MKQNLKILPSEPSRKDICRMYGRQLSEKVILDNINSLIEDLKERKPKLIITPKSLPRIVWLEFLDLFGFPANYETRFEWIEELKVINK
ncbi:hypothetical protein [Flavobacterium sp.]|uniref:hypothetical protein n=1 Tax=Flavobacterium sp. TaxID=239 RepID=UPI00374CB7C4